MNRYPMLFCFVPVLAVLTANLADQPADPNEPLVKTATGTLQGVLEGPLARFKGIPYAAPPVGSLRWREPQAPQAWQGVRKADTFGNACPQPPAKIEGASGDGPQSEDCLYLNVWTPKLKADAKLPVMVWIHGGGFTIGEGNSPLYDGSALAKRGAVVVTVNYRLGHFGFFAHPAVQATPDSLINFGLMDQLAALRWVQENITDFGGDPDNVTIFGESAGAQSVLALFASPLARGMFHKGIAESPYGLPSHTREQAEKIGIDVASAMGLPGEKATLEELRTIPADKLKMLKGKGLSLAPSLVAGDMVLPEPFLETFKKGKQAAVPLIIGSNSNEATVAEAFGVDPAKLVEHVGILKLARRVLYPDVHDEAQYGREVVRDLIFLTFAKRIADTHSLQAPAYRYYFDYMPDQLRGKEPGVPHGGEIVFVFGTASLSKNYQSIFSNPDRLMSHRVGNYWHAFAKTGRPEVEGQPTWPSTSRAQNNVLEFGPTITPRNDFMKKQLDAFDEVLHLLDHFR